VLQWPLAGGASLVVQAEEYWQQDDYGPLKWRIGEAETQAVKFYWAPEDKTWTQK
jgi:hypothetical protein